MTSALLEYLEGPDLPSALECPDALPEAELWRSVPGSGWQICCPYKRYNGDTILAHYHVLQNCVEPEWLLYMELVQHLAWNKLGFRAPGWRWLGQHVRVVAEALLVLDDYRRRHGPEELQAAWALGGYDACALLLGSTWQARSRP